MIRRRSSNLARYGLVDFTDPIFSSLYVGFDRLFENMAQLSAGSKSLPNYPPFNKLIRRLSQRAKKAISD